MNERHITACCETVACLIAPLTSPLLGSAGVQICLESTKAYPLADRRAFRVAPVSVPAAYQPIDMLLGIGQSPKSLVQQLPEDACSLSDGGAKRPAKRNSMGQIDQHSPQAVHVALQTGRCFRHEPAETKEGSSCPQSNTHHRICTYFLVAASEGLAQSTNVALPFRSVTRHNSEP